MGVNVGCVAHPKRPFHGTDGVLTVATIVKAVPIQELPISQGRLRFVRVGDRDHGSTGNRHQFFGLDLADEVHLSHAFSP